ncbi:MAG: hypothetical protein Q7U66_14210 [Methylobacter sp.]|nr:hypothetical protein [Methylobacter sp.]
MKNKKEISISLVVEVDENITPESVAAEVETALSKLDSKVGRMSDVIVRTVPRFEGVGAAGYESRLWEKATCKVAQDPRERIGDPVLEIRKLSETAQRLEAELKSLKESISRLTQQSER